MTGFRLCYNLDKHTPDQDSNLGRTNLVDYILNSVFTVVSYVMR
jgi:hypothetical protein